MFPDVLFPIRSVVVEMRSSSASEISSVLTAASVAEPRLIAMLLVAGTTVTPELAFTAALMAIFELVKLTDVAVIWPPIVTRPEAPEAFKETEDLPTITAPDVVVKELPVRAITPGEVPDEQAVVSMADANETVPEAWALSIRPHEPASIVRGAEACQSMFVALKFV